MIITEQRQRPNAAASGSFPVGGELRVNRLGYGAMQITGPGVFGPPRDHDEAIRVLKACLELNVNFIDTADSYGPDVSEELICEALHPYPPGLVLATKAGFERPAPDKWVTNGRPDHLRRQLDGSLRRLRLERIDLWQLHRIDTKVPSDEQFGAMADFVAEGKVRYLGLSEVSVAQIEMARRVVPIATVQNRYNVAERKAEEVLEYCERESIGFLPWYPLQTGRLAVPGGPLTRIATTHHVAPAQIALAWLLHRSPVMLPIPGTSRLVHLMENVAAAQVELSDEEMAEIERAAHVVEV